jgi:hypothetical protein
MLLSVQALRAELDGMSVKALRERAGQEGCSGERLRHTFSSTRTQAGRTRRQNKKTEQEDSKRLPTLLNLM